MMPQDDALFGAARRGRGWGRTRRGVEEDIRTARQRGAPLAAGTTAVLRVLADQLDDLHAQVSGSGSRPYDRIPLVQLAKQFGETYHLVFGGVDAGDPFEDLLAAFTASETSHPTGPAAPD